MKYYSCNFELLIALKRVGQDEKFSYNPSLSLSLFNNILGGTRARTRGLEGLGQVHPRG